MAQAKGYNVFVSDRGAIKDLYKKELEENDIPYEEGQHDKERIFAADEVVKSPGIPETVPLIKALVAKGIPVIGEIEMASRYTQAKLIGITGSNGKTTTTLLTYHLMQKCGKAVAVGGNVGTSFARNVLDNDQPIHVLELSSFQLDTIEAFRPDIGMLLNITPDHLDRYDYKMENYIASKFRIAMNLQAEDWFYYNGDDKNVTGNLGLAARSRQRAINSKYFIDGRLKVGGLNFDLRKTVLKGKHNAMNALFAIHAALEFDCDPQLIQDALESFQNDPNRMERVAIINDVEYINDSKATNVDATYYALDAMDGPTVWIVGGQDKGNDYAPLLGLVEGKVKAMICLGVDNQKLRDTFKGLVKGPVIESKSAEDAVQQAYRLAKPGDRVLLSPACASFDLFKSYIDRGNQFREAVKKIKE